MVGAALLSLHYRAAIDLPPLYSATALLCRRSLQARPCAVGTRGAPRCGAPPRRRLALRGGPLGGGPVRGGAAQPHRPHRPRRRRHRRLRCEWRQPGGARARQPWDHLWSRAAAWCRPPKAAGGLLGAPTPRPVLGPSFLDTAAVNSSVYSVGLLRCEEDVDLYDDWQCYIFAGLCCWL